MAADPNVDPFSSIGGGVYLNGGWVPKGHPAAQAAGNLGNDQVGKAVGAPAAATTVPGQAAAASTYSSTPGAAPAANTTNQGTQDVVRNSYLQQATQGTKIDPNDPNVQQQVQPYAAAQERGRVQAENEAAERASAQGIGSSGALDVQRRAAQETAAQNTGQFASTVMGNELKNRRDEIQNALTSMKGMISNDQAMALQDKLAQLDAAIKREGITSASTTAANQLGLQDKLGTGGLSVDLIKALMQNQQFGTDAGIRIGEDEMNGYKSMFQ